MTAPVGTLIIPPFVTQPLELILLKVRVPLAEAMISNLSILAYPFRPIWLPAAGTSMVNCACYWVAVDGGAHTNRYPRPSW